MNARVLALLALSAGLGLIGAALAQHGTDAGLELVVVLAVLASGDDDRYRLNLTLDNAAGSPEEHDKNLKAAQLLVKHLVDLADPGRDDLLFAVVGVPSNASKKNKQGILDACKEVLDAVMIVSEPFTVAYGMGRMSDVLVIDIGAGTTDLCRMHGTVPGEDDEISYALAGDSVDQKLFELIMDKYPKAQLTQNMCKTFKEQYGFVSDANDKVEVMIPVDGTPTPHDITQEIKQACEILIPHIAIGLLRPLDLAVLLAGLLGGRAVLGAVFGLAATHRELSFAQSTVWRRDISPV